VTGLEVLADGLRFGEGPRWHSGKLWFSDMYDHAVKTVDLDGQVQVKVDLPGQPSGLGWLPSGDLLVVLMRLGALEVDAASSSFHRLLAFPRPAAPQSDRPPPQNHA
jgi:sugar lactone lactonase YvrE